MNKNSEILLGSKVVVTLEGLRKHSKSIPSHLSYSYAIINWRKILYELCDKKTICLVTAIFDINYDIRYKGIYTIMVPKYMVEKVKE